MTTQDTRTIDESQARALEQLRSAQSVTVNANMEVITPVKDEALPFGKDDSMVARQISSAGYVYVWDTRSYEKLPVLYYMLPAKLRQKREDGSYCFTVIDPKKEPWRGDVKCMLHKDSPDRKYYDTLGFRECKKQNITNKHALTQHMRLKHPQEWKFIEEEKKEKERQEDRKLQQAILGRVASPKEEIKLEPKIEVKPAEIKVDGKFICEVCKADFGAQKTLDKHKLEQHK